MGNHNTQYFHTIFFFVLNNQSKLKFMSRAKNVSEKALICYTFTSDWVRKSPKNFQSIETCLSKIRDTVRRLLQFT